jgi:polyisoprenoid-binding protein YceI
MPTTYKIDPAHSSASFVIRHLMISNVRGSFSNIQGSVTWDAENPGSSSIEAVIDATTLNTQEPNRDTHVKSGDFLDVEKFPTFTFKSTGVESTGEGELKVKGDLTMHGVTKPVVLSVEGPTAESKDPWGNARVGASATTKIKRSDFGIVYNAPLETGGLLLGDDLKIELDLELIKG